jgi:hypothetical protein
MFVWGGGGGGVVAVTFFESLNISESSLQSIKKTENNLIQTPVYTFVILHTCSIRIHFILLYAFLALKTLKFQEKRA